VSTDWRQERIAKNETSFRDINERLKRDLEHVQHAPTLEQFICECGDRSCEELVSLTFEEYEAVRRDSRRFAVVPGHVFPEVERVVHSSPRYEIVEKIGDTVPVADAADHRAAGSAGRRGGPAAP
jgi:hypothetical protein